MVTKTDKDIAMERLGEQLDAVEDVIHLHRCFSCQIATAQTPVILMQDIPQGTRVVVVGICDTCKDAEEGV